MLLASMLVPWALARMYQGFEMLETRLDDDFFPLFTHAGQRQESNKKGILYPV
jgi:hypothetical protein